MAAIAVVCWYNVSWAVVSLSLTQSVHSGCYNLCNGEAEATVSNFPSMGPFFITWSGGSISGGSTTTKVLTNSIILNLCPGTYSVVARDSSTGEVSDVIQFVIPNAPPLLANFTITDPTCNDSADAAVSVSVSGGTGPYKYQWSTHPDDTLDNIDSLPAGMYTVNIRDVNGCTLIDSVMITEPDTLLANVTGTHETCAGYCNGTVMANPSGGTGPYTYSWDNGAVDQSLSGICMGKFVVTVTDDRGCQAQDSFTVMVADTLKNNLIAVNDTCYQGCQGKITSEVTGGTKPYMHHWSGLTSTDSMVSGLCAGLYTHTVSDSNGCFIMTNVTIDEGSQITIQDSIYASSCGVCDGILKVFPSGGTAPYSYQWSTGPNDTLFADSNLCAGVYQVTVTDTFSCSQQFSLVLSDDTSGIKGAFAITNDVDCYGQCTGSANVRSVGGQGPFTYSWSPGGQTDSSVTGLCAGDYYVTITDNNSCVHIEKITINEPDTLLFTADVIPPTCYNQCDAQASLSISGGTPPYSIQWLNSNVSGAVAGNLCAGKHPVSVQDANGCLVIDTVTIPETDSLDIQLTIADAICYDSCSGIAEAMITGGQGPYQVTWSTGQTGMMATGMCSGDYSITVTDNLGCSKSMAFNLASANPIVSNFSVGDANCNLNDGYINVSPSGGTGPISILWFNNTYADSIGGLSTGVYTVTLTDSVGCSVDETIAVGGLNGPTVSATINNVSCSEQCNGTASVTASGTNGPYTYLWTPGGAITSTVSGLCEGTHYVQVSDGNSCSTLKEIVIGAPEEISVDFSVTPNSCFGTCDGSIVANVNGGTPPYNYNWSSGSNTNATNGLCDGNYSLTVTDSKGCSISLPVSLDGPAALSIDLQTSNLDCYNVCNGEITSQVSGGTAPYAYSWSNGGSGDMITDLCAGSYTLTVVDANGCSVDETISIANGNQIFANVNTTLADCGMCNGGASALANGGNGSPYTYVWSTGDSGTSVTDLCAGIYELTVYDYAGCSASFDVTISNNGGPALADSTVSASCFGFCDGRAIVTPTGGVLPYTYQWSDNSLQTTDTANNLCAGSYSVVVTDSVGCVTISDPIVVSEPQQLVNQFGIVSILCPGDSNATINANVSGGMAPYSYTWSTSANDTLDFIDSLFAGTYSVSITDSSGCTLMDTIDVVDPTPLQLTFMSQNVSCFGMCDGIASVTVIGGNAPYTYIWNGNAGANQTVAIDLCSGYQVVEVTDNNGCSFIDSVQLVEPAAIAVNKTVNNPSCHDGTDGSIILMPSGGSDSYSYLWNNGTADSSVGNLGAGTYICQITDSKGCILFDTTIINNPTAIQVAFATTPANCDSADGSITATPSGGSGSYSFLWNSIPSQTTAIASNLRAGVYEVTVTDNSTMCMVTESVALNNIGGPSVSTTVIDETCPDACNGSGTAVVVGGAINHGFLWDDPSATTDSLANSLCPGMYTVRVHSLASPRCYSFDTVLINPSDSIFTRIKNIVQPLCFGDCNGEATAEHIGGPAPITYSWNTTPIQTLATAIDLCAGQYIISTTDSNSCASNATLELEEPDSLYIDQISVEAISCNNTCDGVARLSIVGGTAPYRVLWNSQLGSAINNGLCAGTNFIEVIDANNCSVFDTIDVPDVSPIVAGEIISFPSCGNSDGSIALNPTGGTGPYTFDWSDGTKSMTNNALFAGIYVVTIADSKGCSETFTYFLNNPNAPNLLFDKDSVNCNGDCNGVARVTPSGGVAPYQYSWDYSPVSEDDSLVSLCPGVYFVRVTDASDCIAFGSDTIAEPDVLIASAQKITDGCGGACSGEATVVPTGGNTSYTYSWNTSPVQTGQTATELCLGTAVVTVTDNKNCVAQDSVEIIPPDTLKIDSLVILPASCNTNTDGTATIYVSGGTEPYRYNWNNGQMDSSAINLGPGTYFIEILDTVDCSILDTAIVPSLDTVIVQAVDDFNTCLGDMAQLTGSGLGVTTYQWFRIDPDSLADIGVGDSIMVTINDTTRYVLRGINDASPPCFDLDTVTVNGIEAPIIDAGPDRIIEEGDRTQLLASPFLSGGSFAWTPSTGLTDTAAVDPIASPDETTLYIVRGTDRDGCVGTDSVLVEVLVDNRIVNGFTPNGDGKNDTWKISFIEGYASVIVEVYNRWGQKVFESVGYSQEWDGNFEGAPLPSAVYYYVIDLNGDGEEVFTGPLTLMR